MQRNDFLQNLNLEKKRMSFVLKIDPVQTAQRYNFKCAATCLSNYTQPEKMSKYFQSILIPENLQYYLCMWCSRTPSIAIGLPYENINVKKDIELTSASSGDTFIIKEDGPYELKFKTYGIFCSLGCCKAFWLENRQRTEFELAGLFLHQIWTAEYGANVEFRESPPRETLKIFGGTLSHEEFHNCNPGKKLKIVTLLHSPVIFECEK